MELYRIVYGICVRCIYYENRTATSYHGRLFEHVYHTNTFYEETRGSDQGPTETSWINRERR